MSAITRSSVASLDMNSADAAHKITGLVAGEDLDGVSACFIDPSDGKVYMATEGDGFAGVCPADTPANHPVTLFGPGARFELRASGGTPFAGVFLSASVAGGFDTAGDSKIGFMINARDILITNLLTEAESSG